MKNHQKGITANELIISTAVLGVVALIATAGFQYYVPKAQASEVHGLMQAEKLLLVKSIGEGVCHEANKGLRKGVYGELKISGTPNSSVGASCPSGCKLTYTFTSNAHKQLSGKKLEVDVLRDMRLSNTDSTTLDQKYLPLEIPKIATHAGDDCKSISPTNPSVTNGNDGGTEVGVVDPSTPPEPSNPTTPTDPTTPTTPTDPTAPTDPNGGTTPAPTNPDVSGGTDPVGKDEAVNFQSTSSGNFNDSFTYSGYDTGFSSTTTGYFHNWSDLGFNYQAATFQDSPFAGLYRAPNSWNNYRPSNLTPTKMTIEGMNYSVASLTYSQVLYHVGSGYEGASYYISLAATPIDGAVRRDSFFVNLNGAILELKYTEAIRYRDGRMIYQYLKGYGKNRMYVAYNDNSPEFKAMSTTLQTVNTPTVFRIGLSYNSVK